jgi:predicted nuclease of predicted toxin-antitoxin system
MSVLKFIIDTQLPQMLAAYFRQKGFDAIHTTHFPEGHLLQDAEISKIAIKDNRIVVTKDSDFPDSFFLKGPPPRVIYLRFGNTKNRELTALLEARWKTVEYLLAENSGMIVLNQEQIISY